MLRSIDRIQLAVPDRAAVAAAWQRQLDASLSREDKVTALGARRSVLAAGTSEIELLEPDGSGAVADFLKARGRPGLFAAGFASADVDALRLRLEAQGVQVAAEGDQLFVVDAHLPGLRSVISPEVSRARTGLLERLYEVTWLVDDAPGFTARFAQAHGLDTSAFVPIESAQYGYAGQLTLFDPQRLDRVEIIHARDTDKTMGRFFVKRGPSLYMCYAETDRADEVRARALEHAPQDWTGPGADTPGLPDNQFLHPRALGGVMLGISRTTYAWSWSGSPERVRPAPAA